jgi:hypothetical protein
MAWMISYRLRVSRIPPTTRVVHAQIRNTVIKGPPVKLLVGNQYPLEPNHIPSSSTPARRFPMTRYLALAPL